MRKYQRRRIGAGADAFQRREADHIERLLEQLPAQAARAGLGNALPPALQLTSPINPLDPPDKHLYWVLRGWPGGQIGYGGTGAGQNATIASTRDIVKGFIYLGSSLGAAFDETNARLGIYTAAPAAHLHITKVAGDENLVTDQDEQAGGWGLVGSTISLALLTNDAATSYVQGPNASGGGVIGCEVSLALPTSVATTGWVLHVIARYSGTGTIPRDQIDIYKNRTYAAGTYTGGTSVATFGGYLAPGPGALQDSITTAWVDYEFPISEAEAASLLTATRISVLFQANATGGGGGSGTAREEVTQVYIAIPGGNAVPLQKWQTDGGGVSNTLDYTTDANANDVLELLGDILRIATTGLEIDIGTPAAGDVLTSQDTEGLIEWLAASDLATRTLYRWAANGYYPVDTEVDGAWIAPTAFTITKVWLHRNGPGTSGSTIVDLNINGTTAYATQASRPTIAFDDADNKVQATLPDTVAVAAGDILTIDIDQIEDGDPTDLTLTIEGA